IEFTASAPIGMSGNVPLYSWIESGASNTATNTVVWVNLGSNTIGVAGSGSNTLTIYMNFLTSNTPVTSGYTGYAPQLECAIGCFQTTYAEYDDGASVFPYYQRWGGLSALPSNWGELSGTVVTFASTYTEVAPASSAGGWYGISLNPIPASLSSTTTVWDFYGNMYDIIGAGSYIGTSDASNGNLYSAFYSGYAYSEGNSPNNLIYLGNNGQFDASTSTVDTNNNKIYTMQMNSATSLSMLINYASIYSTSSATSEAPTYFVFDPSNNGGSSPSTPQYIYWLRTRAYPPNGVMPSQSFGTLS
ncbi:MAG: hypothetical protein QXD23_02040, partial [Candidatus Micrarchaeaceae archaeon]